MKRAVASLIIGLSGVAMFAYGLAQTIKIGTCASGNTAYVIANPCPSGSGTKILLLAAGIVLATIGMLVGMGRTALLIWSALFLAGGIAALLASLSGHSGTGGRTAGIIIGAVFIPMGAVPMLWLIFSGGSTLRERRQRARSKEADGTVARVEELQRFGRNEAKVRVTYSVQPLDDVTFELSRETNALLTHMPQTGDLVRIRYDPHNHERFELIDPGAAADGARHAQMMRSRSAAPS